MGLGWFSDSCALGRTLPGCTYVWREKEKEAYTYICIYRYADMHAYMYMYGIFRASAHSYMKAFFHSHLVHSLVVDSSIRLLIHCLVD